MKNTVIQKFIFNKLDRNLRETSLLGDIVQEIDAIEYIAKTNNNIRQASSSHMLLECQKIKVDLLKLSKDKKFLRLKTYSLFKLLKLKYKLSYQEVFDI